MPHLSADLQDLLTHQHVLLLQGKMGSFFSRFATFLKNHGIKVTKVNFNAGDAYFYKHDATYDFTGRSEELAPWLDDLLMKTQADAVVCFGDSRPHHLIAREVLQIRDLPLFVFEEGYLRPYYITLEKQGTNAFSRIQFNQAHQCVSALDDIAEEEKPVKVKNNFAYMTCIIILYYAICRIFQSRFPHYQHYRKMTVWQEAGSWLRAPYYRLFEKEKDKRLQHQLVNTLSEQYFLVTLQVHNDFQITQHSDYDDVIEFIDEVINNFSQYAFTSDHLLLKHHPMDRGHRHYGELIKQLAHKYNVVDRIHYGCDMHLPTVIKHSKGMVTINSTTGLQALYREKPVITLSKAVYSHAGLTYQGTLDAFWRDQGTVNYDNYHAFRKLLMQTCQLNGTFYNGNPWMEHTYDTDAFVKDREGQDLEPMLNESELETSAIEKRDAAIQDMSSQNQPAA